MPSFTGPVRWPLGGLALADDVASLLELEAAEFAAVLGTPVHIDLDGADDGGPDTWAVRVDPHVAAATLEAEARSRRLVLALPTPSDLLDGVNLLHSLAHAPTAVVQDVEAATYAETADRIRAELAHVYPYAELRGLDLVRVAERYDHLRGLEGVEFWDEAARWVAELGDAHTQLITPGPRFHPPYVAQMRADGAVLLEVPDDTAAWAAGVRPGHVLTVADPGAWLARTGASPHQHALVAGRRFLAAEGAARRFEAYGPDGVRRAWTEERRARPSVVARGNQVHIRSFAPEVPNRLREALARANPDEELVLDLRGNVGGSLVAAAEARRLFVRRAATFGSIAFTTGRGTLAPAQPLTIRPDDEPWPGRVRVLVDALTYSAAEDFLHPLVGLPHVEVVGGPTGGGSGRPHTRLLKDGVRLSVSTAITFTRDGRPIEFRGISGCSR
nr:S41 family peptidase [Cellulomonas sp. APG4]